MFFFFLIVELGIWKMVKQVIFIFNYIVKKKKDLKLNLFKVYNVKRISGGKNIFVKLGICCIFFNISVEEFFVKVLEIW